jgi:GcrA cell cycle regulator
MPTEATWTEERVRQLRSFVIAGLSTSQIAAEIGVTRNAVIGKIHRLGLARERPAAVATRMRAPRPRPTRVLRLLRAIREDAAPVIRLETLTTLPVESTQRCSLLDLASGKCRWPLSDPGKADFGFCGNDAIAGISYCVGHARLAYRLPTRRRA